MSKIIIISTPIGNLEDITIRSLKILKSVKVIICENYDKIKYLLQKYEISYEDKVFIRYNDQSTQKDRDRIFSLNFTEAALVSDAGTPLVSDPGYKLIREAVERKMDVDFLPGPSALIMALVLSGFSTDKFIFLGFLPKKKRKALLMEYMSLNLTVIIYESVHRIESTLDVIFEIKENANIAILREGTKMHQEILRFNKNNRPILKLRGEFSIAIE